MKKTALFLCIIATTLKVHGQSLSGYTQQQVNTMIKPFNNYSQMPKITSVWFDKSIINNILALLNSEVAQYGTDGLRIYFADDNSNNETIVLVSTFNQGQPNPRSAESDYYHDDYYTHSPSAALFKMTIPITGVPCHDQSCDGGALLYVKSGLPDDSTCDKNNPHYLERGMCEDMVIGFANQKTKINSRGEWFDLDMLNGFSEVFKNQSIDGIRIYFGRHPIYDQYSWYGGMDGFVMVPTQAVVDPKTQDTIHRDFFDCHFASNYFINSMKDTRRHFIKPPKKNKHALLVFPLASYGGQDNGELCPNNCNE
ncbi:MAG TPA: hypothetical protein VFE53_08215 [Mucilaginibacter sp.]|jgi:hypothetical protein|nr:hypothetical protein [Mucilaginibacter sp.]